MSSYRMSIGIFAIVLACGHSLTARAEEPKVAPPAHYVDKEALELRMKIEDAKKSIAEAKASTKPDAEKQAEIARYEAVIADAQSKLVTESQQQNSVNRKAKKVARDEQELIDLEKALNDANVKYSEDQAKGVVLTPEAKAAAIAEQKSRVSRIAFLKKRIGRKESQIQSKGASYEDLKPKANEVKKVETSTLPIIGLSEKRKKPECWSDGPPLKQKIVKYFDTGKTTVDVDGYASLPVDRDKIDRDLFSQVTALRSEGNFGQDQRIGHVVVVGHNSKVAFRPPNDSGGPDWLSIQRRVDAVDQFEKTLRDGKQDAHLLDDIYSPSLPLADDRVQFTSVERKDVGPSYKVGTYGKRAGMKVVRAAACDSSRSDLSKCDAKQCYADDICDRANALAKDAANSPSPALARKADGSFDRDQTIRNLEACCSANQAELTYKPHQYVEIQVVPSKFTPESPSCSEAIRISTIPTKGTKVGENPGPTVGSLPAQGGSLPAQGGSLPAQGGLKPGQGGGKPAQGDTKSSGTIDGVDHY